MGSSLRCLCSSLRSTRGENLQCLKSDDDNGGPLVGCTIMRIPTTTTVSFRIAALSLVYVSANNPSKPYIKEFHNELTIPEDPFQQVTRPSPNRQQPKRQGLFPKEEGTEDGEEGEAQGIQEIDETPPPPPPVDKPPATPSTQQIAPDEPMAPQQVKPPPPKPTPH